jgi:hypothetical protein
LRAHGFKDKILGDFFAINLRKAIVGWFNVNSSGVNKNVNYTIHFMPNEITLNEPEFWLDMNVSFPYEAMIEVAMQTKDI